MEQREITARGNSLQKAISNKHSKDEIMTILKELKSNVKPTEDLLRKTAIGKIVNKVKGVQDFGPDVPRLASEIISTWRNAINGQKQVSGSSTPNGARSNGTASPAPAVKPPSTSSATSAPSKSATPTGVPADKRTWKTDKVPRDDLTDDSARNNCIGLLYDGLCPGSELPMKHILDLAKQIEIAAINLPESKSSSSSPFYKDKIRSLFQNLRNKSNPNLKRRILNGDVAPKRFVVMTHEEMRSKEQKEEDRKIEKENMDKAMVAQEQKAVSNSLECGKCHQKKVSYTQAQTRSADEPMTTFCECMNCGNRWKFC